MTKTIKNAVMVFTLLAAIFLIFFCIELILVNRTTDDDDTTASASQTQDDGDDGDNEDTQNVDQQSDDTNGNGDVSDLADIYFPMPGEGTRFEMPMDGTDLTLVAYPDLDFFNLVDGEHEWLFVYPLGGTAALEISFDFIPPLVGISGLAENFLDIYVDGAQTRVRGEGYIGNSPLRGYAVIGEREDGMEFEAWIYSLESPDAGLAVTFIMQSENETQRVALRTIIDSMVMEGLEDEEEEGDAA